MGVSGVMSDARGRRWRIGLDCNVIPLVERADPHYHLYMRPLTTFVTSCEPQPKARTIARPGPRCSSLCTQLQPLVLPQPSHT
jgi:hypothetical protein